MSYCRSYTYYARLLFCYSVRSLWWGTVGSHLIWAWLLMYVCMFSLLQHTIGFPLRAFPPGLTTVCASRPQTALRICSTATNTNRTLACRRTAWLRSWWRTCERRTTNSLWLIKYTSFPSCSSSLSDCCLKCDVRLPKKNSNLIQVLLPVEIIVFKVQLLSFFLLKMVLSWNAIIYSDLGNVCASRKHDGVFLTWPIKTLDTVYHST